jgi:hypothetical protein
VQALRQKLAEYFQALTPEQKSWDQFSDAQASGDPNRLLAAVEQSPEDVRSNISQQVAWQFANNGDLPRVRQVAESLTDPLQPNRSCSKRCVNPHGTPVTREISRRPVNSHNKSRPRKIAPPCWRNSL